MKYIAYLFVVTSIIGCSPEESASFIGKKYSFKELVEDKNYYCVIDDSGKVKLISEDSIFTASVRMGLFNYWKEHFDNNETIRYFKFIDENKMQIGLDKPGDTLQIYNASYLAVDNEIKITIPEFSRLIFGKISDDGKHFDRCSVCLIVKRGINDQLIPFFDYCSGITPMVRLQIEATLKMLSNGNFINAYYYQIRYLKSN